MNQDAHTSDQEFLARCYASILERNPPDAQPPLWRKAHELESRAPIYVVFSVDTAGIHFSSASVERISGFPGAENNEEQYRLLAGPNRSEVLTVPLSYFDLYYVPYRRKGDSILAERRNHG